ncbi:M50 family metallopeptidase [Arthrobacter sp. ISL-30]|uniref:M50 family metallopeptidase n=1 Tax=Arthrobacter sp. ISL-30 TaxID=2819109 RepID=UPI001BEC0E1B|nr:M50 family metallopeptidase [Arthrobacter sp. ISL-30]MBT2512956.1 M50 family metallopeptidase [Arthrobacter sp. ISL-30]
MNTELLPSDVASDWWQAILRGLTAREIPALTAPVVLAMLAAAVVLSIPRATWRWFGLYVTFVHELGHAFAALMTGRFVHGLRIGLDHSGQLVSSGRGRLGAAWSGFWGYPTPAVVGAALVSSVSAGWSGIAMTVGALLLLLALIFLRNLTGILVAVCSAATAQAMVMFAGPLAVSYVALALGIALGVGAVRDFFKVTAVHTRRRHRLATSDAYILARSTGVPSFLWLSGFAAVIAVSTALSASLVWGMLSA